MTELHRNNTTSANSSENLLKQSVEALKNHWQYDARWQGVERPYTAEEVIRYRGSLAIENTIARRTAERLQETKRCSRLQLA